MLPSQSFTTWKVCLTILHSFAIGSTGLRLWDRLRIQKLWWDDFVAVVPMALDVCYTVFFWHLLSTQNPTPEQELKSIRLDWASSLVYFTIIWSSRISLSLSLTRIFTPGLRVRKWLGGLTASFLAAYIISSILMAITCATGMTEAPGFRVDDQVCQKTSGGYYLAGIIAICFDFLANTLLATLPLALLWRVQLPEIERRMVLAAFSASILSALAGVVFCVFWYGGLDLGPDRRILLAGVCHIQAAISLIVCNLLVVTMYFYRQFRGPPHAPSSYITATPTRTNTTDSSPCPSPDFSNVPSLNRHRGPDTGTGIGNASVTLELPDRDPDGYYDLTPISNQEHQLSLPQRSFSISINSCNIPNLHHDIGVGRRHHQQHQRPMSSTSTFQSVARHMAERPNSFHCHQSQYRSTQSEPATR